MSDAPEDAPPDADDTTDAPAAPEEAKANEALIHHDAIHGESPRDGSTLAPVPISPVAEIEASVRRAAKASVEHGALDLEARARLLRRFADALLARGEELAAVIEAETGKPAVEAWLHEVLPVADLRDYWCVEGPMYLAATEPPLDAMSYPGKRALVERRPRGVVALITPWNFPAALPLRTIFPALLAGDAVMLKPSEHTPRTAALLVELARGVYGADLVQIVQGDGHAGAALIAAGVDAVVFTGSVPTGRKVAHLAADALVPVSLELGGKDAAIVLDDAPLERTARGVLFGAMINAGQNCAGIERVYATPGIAKALRARVAELAKELVPGRDVGPLCTAAQLATVHAHVQAARDAGAEVLAGGEDVEGAGRYYAPTVLAGVPADNAALLEESFGPIVPILEVADVDAAVEAANSGRFGLTASVWTR
ncbi:MAG: aldehyde dehydrogenase family protein, partial [Myxococcales bacterium]|nr:aldehyde dehydrogenase family protein [Myxococcales bacterium]